MAQARKRQQSQAGSKKEAVQRKPGDSSSRVGDTETQAIESGEPGLTGCRQDQTSDQLGRPASGTKTKEKAKDSPEQAWESGRREAMP